MVTSADILQIILGRKAFMGIYIALGLFFGLYVSLSSFTNLIPSVSVNWLQMNKRCLADDLRHCFLLLFALVIATPF